MQMKRRIICIRNDTKRPKNIAKKRTTSKSVYEEILMLILVNIKRKTSIGKNTKFKQSMHKQS